jgi:uncharacterized protein (DUF58 family)
MSRSFPISGLNSLRQSGQQRMAQWMARRIPASTTLTLSHRSLFIFPTRMGWAYLGLCVILYLLGSNYENNLVVGLAYLMISLLIVSILHCHQNLSGLSVQGLPPSEVHAGQPLRFLVRLQPGSRHRYDLHLHADTGLSETLAACDNDCTLGIVFITHQRGLFQPPRFRLSSEWPFGLLRCWTWLDLQQSAWVYPTPIPSPLPLEQLALDDDTSAHAYQRLSGQMDEIEGLKPYRAGEPLTHVSWRHVLQGRGWFSKSFVAPAAESHQLRLDPALRGAACEQALSELCDQALQLHRRQHPFSLHLGTVDFPVGTGEPHLYQCLLAMARYDAHFL